MTEWLPDKDLRCCESAEHSPLTSYILILILIALQTRSQNPLLFDGRLWRPSPQPSPDLFQSIQIPKTNTVAGIRF